MVNGVSLLSPHAAQPGTVYSLSPCPVLAYTIGMMTLRLILIALLLSMTPAKSGSFMSGSNTCPSSGNKAVAASTTKAVWYVIQTPTTNGGKIYVGGSNVTTSTGTALSAGDSLSAPPQGNSAAYDLAKTYIACTVNTDSVTYIYAQ